MLINVLLLAIVLSLTEGARNPKVDSPVGSILGSYMKTRRDRIFEGYRGIRYAEAPVGALRFEPPKPISKYKTTFNASAEGPACPTPADEYYYGNFSEDCLRLNVYTPNSKPKNGPYPVIVYIHSGGFYSVSGRSDIAGPDYLLDRDVVLVTINYRLGSLGFISTGDALAPGNNGFKDQVVALKWIKNNIAHFGGDPNSITLTGCSAGSYSVLLHMISPMSKGLFHRGISLSGSPTDKAPLGRELRSLAVKQADILNCPTNSSKAILDCLRTKTWREIGDSLNGFFEYNYDPVLVWEPIVELDFGQERFLTMDPTEAIQKGEFTSMPYIISLTEYEFYWKAFYLLQNSTWVQNFNDNWEKCSKISFILPQDKRLPAASQAIKEQYFGGRKLSIGDNTTIHDLGTCYGDAIIGLSAHRLANLMCRHSSQPVYYTKFSYYGQYSHYQDPVTNKPIGAMHHDDLLYLFGLTFNWPLIKTDSDDSFMVDRMTGIWYQFAKYGDMTPRGDIPEIASLHWPQMKPDDRKYLQNGKQMSLEKNMFEERFKFWDELYPIKY